MAESKKPERETIEEFDENIALEAARLIERQLVKFDRGAFRKALAELLGCRPTPKALFKFAQKSPDRWAQAATLLGQLAGFEKGINVNLNYKDVAGMPDAALIEEVQRLSREVRALARGPAGEVLDAEIIAPALPPADEKVKDE